MSSEFYNNPKRYKPRNKHRGAYKPRHKSGRSVLVKVIVVLIIVCAAAFGVIMLLPKISGGRIALFNRVEATPAPTQQPKTTEHPLESTDIDEIVHDVAVADNAFQWFADSYANNNTLMFCGGEVVQGDAYMTALFQVSTSEGASMTAKRVNVMLENDHIMYPQFNDEWIVYLDAKANGGGSIKCCKQGGDLSKSTLVKKIYTGQPSLYLSGNYLAWTERTGTSMDKLYLCDLTTLESATVQMFNKTTYYGVSKPHLTDKTLVWADVDTEKSTGSITSQICVLNTETGEYMSYKPYMYAHDPKSNGNDYIAWLTGNHGVDTDLYISKELGEPKLVAKAVFDFYMDKEFLAYQKDEMVFVYIFSTGTEYKLSKNGQSVQLLGASDGCVVWSDVTSREREILEYARIPN